MDPDAAWAIVANVRTPPAEKAQAARDLLEWLDKGGFMPTCVPPIDHEPGLERVFMVQRLKALIELCEKYAEGKP
jgi:hypothetical protein